jgi:Transposase DDE domain group 1
MQRFVLEQSSREIHTSHAGLALLGRAIRLSGLDAAVDELPLLHGIAHRDIVKSYLGILALGKSDFEAVGNVRADPFFRQALDLERVPSAARLRLRLDQHAEVLMERVDVALVEFLKTAQVPITPLRTGHMSLDLDVFPLDNSGTKKEGVGRTYAGYDGYAPIGGYLGEEGWCLACELRPGIQHSQREFLYVLERVVPRARTLTALPLLMRLDSGHDAWENRIFCIEQDIDFIIKWNPRKESPEQWRRVAEAAGHWVNWEQPRPGKRVGTFTVYLEHREGTRTYTARRVMRVTERTIDAQGQALLVPEVDIEGWWTSLELPDAEIIRLYAEHATSEQFHSEFKTDLDIERLPSGKFATNDLVLAMAALVYNILRYIGLAGLIGPDAPVRHPAKRRRIRTVMQELMYLAARLINHGRQWYLRFGRHCPGFHAFGRVYQALVPG